MRAEQGNKQRKFKCTDRVRLQRELHPLHQELACLLLLTVRDAIDLHSFDGVHHVEWLCPFGLWTRCVARTSTHRLRSLMKKNATPSRPSGNGTGTNVWIVDYLPQPYINRLVFYVYLVYQ